MSDMPPIGVKLSADVEYREGRKLPYKARVRWIDPVSKLRKSKSEHVATADAAKLWIDEKKRAAESGVDPDAATKKLADYGHAVMGFALRGLEAVCDLQGVDGHDDHLARAPCREAIELWPS